MVATEAGVLDNTEVAMLVSKPREDDAASGDREVGATTTVVVMNVETRTVVTAG